MGVLSGKDVFNKNFITAEISDSEDRLHFVPIRHTVGDYFVTELDGKLYAFSLKGARILTYRQTLVRSFRVIRYDTSAFSSLKAETKELEKFLRDNALPKMNMIQLKGLRIMGLAETKQTKEHDVKSFIAELEKKKEQYPEEISNMIKYFEQLKIDKIVTPVRKITDFLQEDLITTQPSFLGEMLPRYQRLDTEHKKMTNTAIGSKKAWLPILMILMFVVMVVVIIAYGAEQGWFDSIMASFGGFGNIAGPLSFTPPPAINDPCSDERLQAAYTPEELRAAVDRGEIDYETCLSPNMKSLVDGVKLPTASET